MYYLDDISEFRIGVLESLDTPRSLSLAIIYRHLIDSFHFYWEYASEENFSKLLKEAEIGFCYELAVILGSTDPLGYLDEDRLRCDLQAGALFSKSDDLPINQESLEADAIAAFEACESACRETNIRFLCKEVDSALVFSVSKIIEKIIGYAPTKAYDELRYGPGATSSCRGRDNHIVYKLSCDNEVTPRALRRAKQASIDSKNRYFYRTDFKIVPGNTAVFIPKSYKELRQICIPVHANVPLQLSAGAELRYRLKHSFARIDINCQSDLHRVLMVECWDQIVTIDLRRASSMIAKQAVMQTFPPGWLDHLADLREEYTFISDKWHYNQHFSAMGNGYTFELETILFYSICLASCELYAGRRPAILTVFGDDIIVSPGFEDAVFRGLHEFGLLVNKEKTFTTGYFRESCGFDTFKGRAVRPVYLRNIMELTHEERSIKLSNLVFDIARRAYPSEIQFRDSYSVVCSDDADQEGSCSTTDGLLDIILHGVRWSSSLSVSYSFADRRFFELWKLLFFDALDLTGCLGGQDDTALLVDRATYFSLSRSRRKRSKYRLAKRFYDLIPFTGFSSEALVGALLLGYNERTARRNSRYKLIRVSNPDALWNVSPIVWI